MKQKGKKYILKESELREILGEMVLSELYDPNAYRANFINGRRPQQVHLKDVLDPVVGAVKGIPNALISDRWKEKVQTGDNDFLKYILGALGATTNGYAGPDYVPDAKTSTWAGGAGYGTGNNSDAHEVLNVQKAIQEIYRIATPRYDARLNKHCARAVRTALNAGGLTCPWGMYAMHAKNYYNILPKNGWKEIAVNSAGQPGDIVVVTECRGHSSGHIAMCCYNNQWVSDFVQGSMLGLRDGSRIPPACIHVFRYTNIAGVGGGSR